MKALYTAVATSTGGRGGHVRSSDGLLDFDVRAPKEMGGPDGKFTNPEQLFAAGYSACFGSALMHVARLLKITVEPSVTAHVGIGPKEGGGYLLTVELEVKLEGVERKKAEELVAQAHQVCPYSNATRGNIDVTLKVL